jgi:hypothetical protein
VLSGRGKNSSKFWFDFAKFMIFAMEQENLISAETSSQIQINPWHYSFKEAKSSNPPKPGTVVLVSFCAVHYVSSERRSSLVCKNKFNIGFESDQSFLLQNFVIYWISIRCEFFSKNDTLNRALTLQGGGGLQAARGPISSCTNDCVKVYLGWCNMLQLGRNRRGRPGSITVWWVANRWQSDRRGQRHGLFQDESEKEIREEWARSSGH